MFYKFIALLIMISLVGVIYVTIIPQTVYPVKIDTFRNIEEFYIPKNRVNLAKLYIVKSWINHKSSFDKASSPYIANFISKLFKKTTYYLEKYNIKFLDKYIADITKNKSLGFFHNDEIKTLQAEFCLLKKLLLENPFWQSIEEECYEELNNNNIYNGNLSLDYLYKANENFVNQIVTEINKDQTIKENFKDKYNKLEPFINEISQHIESKNKE